MAKKKSQTNIILGGFSGGVPALIGYVAVTTEHLEIGLAMAGLVFLWIPTHLELGIACKERLYKSWCSHVAGSCRRKKVRSSDSWNDSHDGSF